MPPKKVIECAIIIIDCSSDVTEKLKYICKLTSSKFFQKSRDSNKVLFFNSGGSRDTQVVRDWCGYELSNLRELRDEAVELESACSPVELAGALQTAVNCFEDESIVQGHFKRIILVSDLKKATESYEEAELSRRISGVQFELARANIWLHVIGPAVKLPKLCARADVEAFARTLQPAEHLPEREKRVIEQFARLFQASNNGVMCDYENGYNLLHSFVHKQLTSYPYYVDLSIGSTIRVPVVVARATRKPAPVQLRPCFRDEDPASEERACFEKKSHERVERADVVAGYQFHGRRVIREQDSLRDESSLKCLSICAFVAAAELPAELYLMPGDLHVVVPDPRRGAGAQRDLCALLKALRTRDVVAVAKRVYNNKYRPWAFGLFACPEHENCLLMGKLPFRHEFNEKYARGRVVPARAAPLDARQDCAYSFLAAMTAAPEDFCDDGKVLHPLTEHLRQDPNRAFKYEYLALKSLDMVPDGIRFLTPHSILLNRAEHVADELIRHYVDHDEDDAD